MNKRKRIVIENNIYNPEEGKKIDLSKERLSLADYQWLAEIIKRSSFIETILLPKVLTKDAEIIVSILNEATLKNSTLTTLPLDLSDFGDGVPESLSIICQQIQSRLRRNEKKIFAIHGGGNIGLGLMADIISKSPCHYNIVATTSNEFIRTLINSGHKFWLQHGPSSDSETTCVENVEMVSRSSEDVIKLYREACIAAICVTPVVMSSIAKDVAQALLERYKIDGSGLKILVLMNLPHCDRIVREKILAELVLMTGDVSYAKKILSGIEFIPTVIDRIVTPINEEQIAEQLKAQLLKLPENTPVEGDTSTNAPTDSVISTIKNLLQAPYRFLESIVKHRLPFAIFSSADHSSSVSVPDDFPEAYRIPGMRRSPDLTQASNDGNTQSFSNKVEEILHAPEKLAAAVAAFNLQFNLLNAEHAFSMYTPEEFPEATRWPTVNVTKDLERIEAIKNKYINGPHAILSWIGGLLGYATIAEAIKNPVLYAYIKEMIEKEIRPILSVEYPEISSEEFEKLETAFLERCATSEQDPVIRVGRDPLRKLDSGERIRGTIELAGKHHLSSITTRRLEQGIAAGLVYALKQLDPTNPGCKQILSLYKESKGSLRDVLCYTGPAPRGTFTGLDPSKDNALIERILSKAEALDLWYEREQLFSKTTENYTDIALQEKLSALGIRLDIESGHLFYRPAEFKPLSLNFELIFVRHGETYGNCGQSLANGDIDHESVTAGVKDKNKRIYQGDVDTEINQLTNDGRQQALAVAEELNDNFLDKGWEPDVVLVSPLSRAKDTAAPFIRQNFLEHQCIIDESIKEMSFGVWDNRRVCDLPPDDPCHLFYREQHGLVKGGGIGEHSKAENFGEVLLRAYQSLMHLNKKYAGKRIIMFSHSMFGAACCILLGKGQTIENGSYLAFDGKREDGTYYTVPNAKPMALNFDVREEYVDLKSNEVNPFPHDHVRLIEEVFSDTVEDRTFLQAPIPELSKPPLTTVQKQINPGPREMSGWTLKDMDDDSKFFYDVVVHQMQLIYHPFLVEVPAGILPRNHLKMFIQGTTSDDQIWDDDRMYDLFVQKCDVILAIVDTNTPEAGFTCYYRSDDGHTIMNRGETPLPNKPIIRIASTSDRFLSVTNHPDLACGCIRAAFNANPLSRAQQSHITLFATASQDALPKDTDTLDAEQRLLAGKKTN